MSADRRVYSRLVLFDPIKEERMVPMSRCCQGLSGDIVESRNGSGDAEGRFRGVDCAACIQSCHGHHVLVQNSDYALEQA